MGTAEEPYGHSWRKEAVFLLAWIPARQALPLDRCARSKKGSKEAPCRFWPISPCPPPPFAFMKIHQCIRRGNYGQEVHCQFGREAGHPNQFPADTANDMCDSISDLHF